MPNNMTKRAALALYDLAAVTVCGALFSIAYIQPAWAYVDPSVMTYTIQALAGVAVALSAVAGVVFRRTRRKLFKLLGLDENRNKEVEAPVHRLAPDGSAIVSPTERAGRVASGSAGSAGAAARGKKAPAYTPSALTRLLISLAVSVFVVGTLVVVAPYEIVAGNEESLLFGLDKVWPIFVLPAIVAAAAATAVLTCLRGRAFNLAVMLIFGFGLACYVQVLFLNGGLPSADGQTVVWKEFTFVSVSTLAVWLAALLAPLIASRLNMKAVQSVVALVAVALVIVQGVGVGSLFVDPANKKVAVAAEEEGVESYVISNTGLLTVSPNSNLVIFVLDGFDTKADLMPALQTDPHMLDEMTGFTWFQNSAPVITPTREALPSMLTGYVPSPENGDFRTGERYANSPYLADLDGAGYNIGLYSDSLFSDEPNLFEHTINGLPESKDEHEDEAPQVNIDADASRRALFECALYRDLPWVFKPFFWFYTGDLNIAMAEKPEHPETPDAVSGKATEVLSEIPVDPTPYAINDRLFYEKLIGQRLTVVDDGSTGSVRFFHLLGPHFPCTLDENVEVCSATTRQQQARASMRIVSEYIKQLKDLGLYENTTFIITADHGYRSESNFVIQNGQLEMSPIMLVKRPGTTEECRAPLQISQTPVNTCDIMPTLAAQAAGIDASSYPADMFHMTGSNRTRYFYFCTKNEELSEIGVLELKIDGNVLNWDNWSTTGVVHDYSDRQWKQIGDTKEYKDDWLSKLYNY